MLINSEGDIIGQNYNRVSYTTEHTTNIIASRFQDGEDESADMISSS